MSGKVYIVTGTMGEPGSAWWKLHQLTVETKRRTINRWSKGVVEYNGVRVWEALCTDNLTRERKWEHLGFARTRAVEQVMGAEWLYRNSNTAEFVIWMDADSAIVRQDFDIAAYFESFGPDRWFYAADDHNGLQSGIFAFRVCAASLEALERVWNADPKYADGFWYEQGALEEYCQAGRATVEKKLFNAYPWDDYEAGYSWAVHCPARSDAERYKSLRRCIEESEGL